MRLTTFVLLAALSAVSALAAPAPARKKYANRADFITVWLKHYPASTAAVSLDDVFAHKLTQSALEQTQAHIVYNPDYFKIPYPGGDVPAGFGVCTDVLIRAYRAAGDDLQVDVHEDMAAAFAAYPDLWGRESPDSNIDHRRVPNLMAFLGRHAAVLPITKSGADYRPADIVAWDLGGGVTHIGIVVDRMNGDATRPLIVHNIGRGPELQDALFDYKIIGHFRYAGRAAAAPAIRAHPIVTERRLELTRKYCKVHYGLDSASLKDPKIVVVHATEIATLAATLKSFGPDTMDPARGYLNEHGDVNVGVHFVVDRDGSIYSLLPLDVIGRHAIGLNHVSVGIENVGFSDRLTKEQIEADASLIADLVKRLPSLKYVVGHHEYVDRQRPHYALYRELDPKYAPTEKSDPGPGFMSALRGKLSARGLRLGD